MGRAFMKIIIMIMKPMEIQHRNIKESEMKIKKKE